MFLYKFSVERGDEIDLKRVVSESQKDRGELDVLLVRVSNNTSAEDTLLMVSEKFLERFDPSDDIVVAGWSLGRHWGSHWTKAVPWGGGLRWSTGDGEYIPGFRVRCVNSRDLDGVIKQIEAARAWKRKTVVRVHAI